MAAPNESLDWVSFGQVSNLRTWFDPWPFKVANFVAYIMMEMLAISTTILPLLEVIRELAIWGRRRDGRKVQAKDAEGQGQGFSPSVDQDIFRQSVFSRVDDGAVPAVRLTH